MDYIYNLLTNTNTLQSKNKYHTVSTIKRYNTFESFTLLLPELQAEIFKKDRKILKIAPMLSKILKNAQPLVYTHCSEFGNLPLYKIHNISISDIMNEKSCINISVKQGVMTCDKINAGNTVIDLKNMYDIYKHRNYDRVGISYSKVQVKHSLCEFYTNTIQRKDYKNLLFLFLYLELNLKQFDNPSTFDNIYWDFGVDVNDDNGRYGRECFTVAELVLLLVEQTEIMYQQLIDIIDGLD